MVKLPAVATLDRSALPMITTASLLLHYPRDEISAPSGRDLRAKISL